MDSSRFGSHGQGDMYKSRFWKQEYFQAIDVAKRACQQEGISLANASHRWLLWHSKLDGKQGDGIVTAASSYDQAVANFEDFKSGPLPESVVKAFDEGWELIKACSVKLMLFGFM